MMTSMYVKVRRKITRLSAPKMVSALILAAAGLGLLLLVVYGVASTIIVNDYFAKVSQVRNVAPPGSGPTAQNSAIGRYYSLVDLLGLSLLGLLGISLAVTLGYVIGAAVEWRKAVLVELLNSGS